MTQLRCLEVEYNCTVLVVATISSVKATEKMELPNEITNSDNDSNYSIDVDFSSQSTEQIDAQ